MTTLSINVGRHCWSGNFRTNHCNVRRMEIGQKELRIQCLILSASCATHRTQPRGTPPPEDGPGESETDLQNRTMVGRIDMATTAMSISHRKRTRDLLIPVAS